MPFETKIETNPPSHAHALSAREAWAAAITKQFDWRERKLLDREPGEHLFPNDRDFFLALDSISDFKTTVPDNDRVALVVGDSYLLSSLPTIIAKSGARIILVCDVDAAVLQNVMHYHHLLPNINNEEEFLDTIGRADHPVAQIKKNRKISTLLLSPDLEEKSLVELCNHGQLIDDNADHRKEMLSAYRISKKALGSRHCFSSAANFRASQKAHQEVLLIPVCVDLFNEKEVATLSTLLLPKQIVFFNLTNLRQWDHEDKLDTTLRLLPAVPTPIIMRSSHRKNFFQGRENPSSEASIISIDDYNKTFIEDILCSVFIRSLNDRCQLEICKEIIAGINHVNTCDANGFSPIEVATLEFISPLRVELLLKYGAIPTPRILRDQEGLTKLIAAYNDYIFKKTHINLSSIVMSRIQSLKKIEVLLKKAAIIREKPVVPLLQAKAEVTILNPRASYQNIILALTLPGLHETNFAELREIKVPDNLLRKREIPKIMPGEKCFFTGDVHIAYLSAGASVVVMNGNLSIDIVETAPLTHLQTFQQNWFHAPGHITIGSIINKEKAVLRIVAAGNVTLQTDCALTSVDILAWGSISTRHIGPGSYLATKRTITTEGRAHPESIYISAEEWGRWEPNSCHKKMITTFIFKWLVLTAKHPIYEFEWNHQLGCKETSPRKLYDLILRHCSFTPFNFFREFRPQYRYIIPGPLEPNETGMHIYSKTYDHFLITQAQRSPFPPSRSVSMATQENKAEAIMNSPIPSSSSSSLSR